MGMYGCKLSDDQQFELLMSFLNMTSVRAAAADIGVSYHTARLFYHKLRYFMPDLNGVFDRFVEEVKPKEEYFDDWQSDRAETGKIALFCIFSFASKKNINTFMLADTRNKKLEPLIFTGQKSRKKLKPNVIAFADYNARYNTIDVSKLKYVYLDSRYNRESQELCEQFVHYTRHTLGKYRGIPREHFPFFLKEAQFRFYYHRLPAKRRAMALAKAAGIF